MTHDADDLLQARLDGELTDAQRDELARLERERPELRERAAALATLGEWLDTAGTATPPAGFVKTVMSRLRPRVLEFKRPAAAGAYGGSEMKKAMIGVAAAAAVAFVYFAINGFPTADNSQGAIGAAKRYNSGQIASGDVQVGDTSVQQFIQSDTFARLIKDPNAVKLLSDARLRQSLASVAELTSKGGLHDALNDADFAGALARESLGQALSDSALNQALKQPDLARELRDAGLSGNLAGKDLSKELSGQFVAELSLKAPRLAGALKDSNFREAFNKYDLSSALKNAKMAEVPHQRGPAPGLREPGLPGGVQQPVLRSRAEVPRVRQRAAGAAFADALSKPGFGQALNQALRGDLKGDLKGELQGDLKSELKGGVKQ